MSGVTVQDGKYVFVRGLGERYTTSSLNGARVPSPEPEKRVVPLDMFPAGLVQTITTTKTFTPDQQGDFSGALGRHQDEGVPRARARRASSSAAATHPAPRARDCSPRPAWAARGSPWSNSKRDLPPVVRSLGNFQNINLNQGDMNYLVEHVPELVDAEDRDGCAAAERLGCRSAATIRSCSATASAICSPARSRRART